jgi:hypothetical protein
MPPLAEEEDPLEVVPGKGGPEAVSNISTQGLPLPFRMQFILHCGENPIYVYRTFSGTCKASVPISTFMCL